MPLDLYQVDAFTDRPFAGNPAAVCLLPGARDPRWLQDVAREMNLSETAFLYPVSPMPPGDAKPGFRPGDWHLRWFTPATEVELCGHATLASAHVLWQTGRLAAGETARFHTLSGLLTAARKVDGWIELDFPARRVEAVEPPDGLLAAFGLPAFNAEPVFVGKSVYDYLLELPAEAAVRAAAPDFAALRKLPVRGVIVTARADAPPFDIVSRFFAPGAGVDEDPVTGSAHCTLGPYWAARLGKPDLLAYQASARGGVLRVRVDAAREGGERVLLGGQAVTVLAGKLLEGRLAE